MVISKQVSDLSVGVGSNQFEDWSIVVLNDQVSYWSIDSNEDEELGPVRQMLQPIAEKVVAESKANGEEQPLHFFYAGEVRTFGA